MIALSWTDQRYRRSPRSNATMAKTTYMSTIGRSFKNKPPMKAGTSKYAFPSGLIKRTILRWWITRDFAAVLSTIPRDYITPFLLPYVVCREHEYHIPRLIKPTLLPVDLTGVELQSWITWFRCQQRESDRKEGLIVSMCPWRAQNAFSSREAPFTPC